MNPNRLVLEASCGCSWLCKLELWQVTKYTVGIFRCNQDVSVKVNLTSCQKRNLRGILYLSSKRMTYITRVLMKLRKTTSWASWHPLWMSYMKEKINKLLNYGTFLRRTLFWFI